MLAYSTQSSAPMRPSSDRYLQLTVLLNSSGGNFNKINERSSNLAIAKAPSGASIRDIVDRIYSSNIQVTPGFLVTARRYTTRNMDPMRITDVPNYSAERLSEISDAQLTQYVNNPGLRNLMTQVTSKNVDPSTVQRTLDSVRESGIAPLDPTLATTELLNKPVEEESGESAEDVQAFENKFKPKEPAKEPLNRGLTVSPIAATAGGASPSAGEATSGVSGTIAELLPTKERTRRGAMGPVEFSEEEPLTREKGAAYEESQSVESRPLIASSDSSSVQDFIRYQLHDIGESREKYGLPPLTKEEELSAIRHIESLFPKERGAAFDYPESVLGVTDPSVRTVPSELGSEVGPEVGSSPSVLGGSESGTEPTERQTTQEGTTLGPTTQGPKTFVNAIEDTEFTPTVYHRSAIITFFNDADKPKWDPQLSRLVDKAYRNSSSEERAELINTLIFTKGQNFLVVRPKSDGTLQELVEIIQLLFSSKRNMSRGTRVTMAGISLGSLLGGGSYKSDTSRGTPSLDEYSEATNSVGSESGSVGGSSATSYASNSTNSTNQPGMPQSTFEHGQVVLPNELPNVPTSKPTQVDKLVPVDTPDRIKDLSDAYKNSTNFHGFGSTGPRITYPILTGTDTRNKEVGPGLTWLPQFPPRTTFRVELKKGKC